MLQKIYQSFEKIKQLNGFQHWLFLNKNNQHIKMISEKSRDTTD